MGRRLNFEESDCRLREGQAALVAAAVLEPLSTEDADTRLWLDCELASYVENRCFERIDPRRLCDDERQEYERRALHEDERLVSPHRHDWYRTAYWIVEEGARVGTLALTNQTLGAPVVQISSLYVMPDRRGHGVGARALRQVYDGLEPHGITGLRVSTRWTWQAAVRFYLRLGMWVSSWKHDLRFGWDRHLPAWHAEIAGHEARFALGDGSCGDVLLTATRDGERLGWREQAPLVAMRSSLLDVYWKASETFAIVLAVHGWPLVRSEAAWEKRHFSSDGGAPEGLAYKIEIFEAWERKGGFEVRTPRIPGLRYPEWDAFG